MSTKLLTNLLFEPKGVHDPALTYSIKDTVMSPDGSKVYFALRDVPSGIALTDKNYWMLQIDLSGSKNAMDEAVAAFADYAKIVGTRVKGETAKVSGNLVTFLPDAGSLLQPVTVLEPQQEGSGEPTPENIRPFTGYDKLDLNATGKNLLPNNATSQTINGVTFTVNPDGSVTANGTAADRTSISIGKIFLEAGSYTTSQGFVGSGNGAVSYVKYIENGANKYVDLAGVAEKTFILPEKNEIEFVCEIRVAGYTASNVVFRPMVRFASDTDASYKPYKGELHTVQIGQTVYGLRYEWLTGKGVIEWAMQEYPAKTAPNQIETLDGFKRLMYRTPGALSAAQNVECLCNLARTVESDAEARLPWTVRCRWGYANIVVPLEHPGYLEEDLQIVYKLATPIEIQLTPHILTAVEPEQNNTLYGDGTIEVEYVKPLHVSIEERVAAIASAMLMKEE